MFILRKINSVIQKCIILYFNMFLINKRLSPYISLYLQLYLCVICLKSLSLTNGFKNSTDMLDLSLLEITLS